MTHASGVYTYLLSLLKKFWVVFNGINIEQTHGVVAQAVSVL